MTSLILLIILATLISSSLTGDAIPSIKQNYKDMPLLSAKRVESFEFRYVLKVLVQNQNLGLGVYVKPLWVLTSQFFENNNQAILVGTWDSNLDGSGKGQERRVSKVYINPLRSIDGCNFDLAMLKLNTSFDPSPSVGYISYTLTVKPVIGDVVQIPAAFEDGIQAKSVVISELKVCEGHYSYYLYSACTWTIFCLEMNERLYGAPIMKDNLLVGVVPSEVDERVQRAVFHHIEDYQDWLDVLAKATDRQTPRIFELLLTDVTILFLFNYWNT